MNTDPLRDHLYTLRDSDDQHDRGAALDVILDTLSSLINRRYRSGGTVEDTRQEAAFAVLEAADAYDSHKCSATGYLNAMVSFHLSKLYERQNLPSRRPPKRILSLDSAHVGSTRQSNAKTKPIIDTIPDDHQFDVITEVDDRDELRAAWADYRRRLSQFERTAVVRLCQGQTYDEIAQRVSVSAKVIDNALSRARGKTRFVLPRCRD